MRGRDVAPSDAETTTEIEPISGELDTAETPAEHAEQGREGKEGRHRNKRRFIDYPRYGKRGLRHWLPSWRLVLGIFAFFFVAGSSAFLIALANVKIPQPNDFALKQATIFTYSDGKTVIAHLGVNRLSVPLSSVPPLVRSAVLSAEDRNFYTEAAVSPTGTVRAVWNDISSGGNDLQGGSTITQQYVKNYYLSQQQTLGRKVNELLISIKIDEQVPKDTILQNYLNTIFFGRNAYGIEAASRAYFGESVSAVANDPAKAAYLASLIQEPYYFSTAGSDPGAMSVLKQRWNYVLDGMVAEHWLNKDVRSKLTFPTPVTYQSNDLAGTNGYLVNAALQYLERQHATDPNVPSADQVSAGGYTVVTTFRPDYMTAAKNAVAAGTAGLDPTHNAADANLHVGVAAVDPNSGAVLGFYGGPDYVKQSYNDALQAAGPFGKQVSKPIVAGALTGRDKDWNSAVTLLGDLGINDANPNDNPPADDDLSGTPLRAAAAFSMLFRPGQYPDPYEVAQVQQDGRTVWQPNPVTNSRKEPFFTGVSGNDGSQQWSWTIGGGQDATIAVDMYATNANGKGNKTLSGMTAPAASALQQQQQRMAADGGGITGSAVPSLMFSDATTNADLRTQQIFNSFLAATQPVSPPQPDQPGVPTEAAPPSGR